MFCIFSLLGVDNQEQASQVADVGCGRHLSAAKIDVTPLSPTNIEVDHSPLEGSFALLTWGDPLPRLLEGQYEDGT